MSSAAFAGDGDPWDTIGPGIDHAFTTYETWKAEERGEAEVLPKRPDEVDNGRNVDGESTRWADPRDGLAQLRVPRRPRARWRPR